MRRIKNSAIGVDYNKSIYKHSNAIEDTYGFTVGENGKPIVYYEALLQNIKSDKKYALDFLNHFYRG